MGAAILYVLAGVGVAAVIAVGILTLAWYLRGGDR